MSEMWLIARTNVKRLIRQPIMLFTTLALPFVIIAVIGVAIGGGEDRPAVGVVAPAGDPFSSALVSEIDHSTALRAVAYGSTAQLDQAVRRGSVAAGLVVPAGIAAQIEQGGTAGLSFVTTPDQTGAATVRAVLTALVDRVSEPEEIAGFAAAETGLPLSLELSRADRQLPKAPAPAIDEISLAGGGALRMGFEYTGPANLVLFVILTSMTSATTLIESRLTGVTRRMFALPLTRRRVLAGEFLGRFLIALAQALVILALCVLVFGVSWGSPFGTALLVLALCVFGAALGMLVGFLARSTAQAIAFGPGVGVALGMLGGCMWPLRITGRVMADVGHVTPDAWAMDGFIRLTDSGAGAVAVLPQVGVVVAMGVLLALLAGAAVRKAGVR